MALNLTLRSRWNLGFVIIMKPMFLMRPMYLNCSARGRLQSHATGSNRQSSLVFLSSLSLTFLRPHKHNHRRRSSDLHQLNNMSGSDDEDESFARFLESEVSSVEETKEPDAKRQRIEKDEETNAVEKKDEDQKEDGNKDRTDAKRIESGVFSNVPTELFRHILKFLSSEDLVSCSLVCKFLNFAACDESLWRRLYCIRWGLTPPTRKLRQCAWKKLYIDRDEQDMTELVRTCSSDFKEYYIQMQAAKRSQAPLPFQMVDDRIILDKTVLEQVSLWKRSKGLTDTVVTGHICLGTKCSYHQIGDAFICKETGNVHVCDDNCKEVILSPEGDLMVCTISGHCSDTLLVQTDPDPDDGNEEEAELEAEVFTDKSRLARAFELGYNCEDEEELESTQRFC